MPYEEVKEAFSPESLLPMKLSETQVRDSIHRWYGTRWFAPNKLKRGALTDIVKGLYIPYWTFDAQVHSDWTAESGYYYYVTETYTDANGRTQTREVQRSAGNPTAGSLDHFLMTNSSPPQRASTSNGSGKSNHFPRRNSLPTTPVFSPAGSWSVTRLTSLPPPRKHARTWTWKWNSSAGQKCPATLIAT